MNASKIKLICVIGIIATCGTSLLAQGITTSSFGSRITVTRAGARQIAYENDTEIDFGGFFQSAFSEFDPFLGTTFTHTEFGDEVFLRDGVGRLIDSFELEYYTSFKPVADVHQGVVRFYDMEGADDPGGLGDAIFTSLPFNLSDGVGDEGGFSVLELSGFAGGSLPDNLTYSIQFSGVDSAANQVAGLSIYGTPNIGGSANYIWQRLPSGDWRQVVIVPEPTVFQLGLLAGFGWLGFRGYRRLRKS